MYDGGRSGFNSAETRLSPGNAANLKLIWKQKLGSGSTLAAQPIIYSGTLYVGSWDGFLYAMNAADGSLRWKKDLGRTTSQQCTPDTAGISSAPVVTRDALYIGGGDDKLYALNPQTGDTLWTFKTGDNSEQGGAYNWASPLFYKDKVYTGISSFCDKPFPNGKMWGLDAATGKVCPAGKLRAGRPEGRRAVDLAHRGRSHRRFLCHHRLRRLLYSEQLQHGAARPPNTGSPGRLADTD